MPKLKLPKVENITCTIRDAARQKTADGSFVVPAWMAYECGKGTYDGVSFELNPAVSGEVIVMFNKDFDNGHFVITPEDFVAAAYEAYKAKLEET